MILGHSEILRLAKEQNLIEDFEEKNVEGAGVDVRAKTFYMLKNGAKLSEEDRALPEIEEIQEDPVVLKPDDYVLVETIEKVNMPLDLCAWMRHRSTLQRSGVALFTALIDPGYQGGLVFGMKNQGAFDFEIKKGTRVGQLIFEQVRGDAKEYAGRYQGGKVV